MGPLSTLAKRGRKKRSRNLRAMLRFRYLFHPPAVPFRRSRHSFSGFHHSESFFPGTAALSINGMPRVGDGGAHHKGGGTRDELRRAKHPNRSGRAQGHSLGEPSNLARGKVRQVRPVGQSASRPLRMSSSSSMARILGGSLRDCNCFQICGSVAVSNTLQVCVGSLSWQDRQQNVKNSAMHVLEAMRG